MRIAKWLLVAASIGAVARANAEGPDCPEPTPGQRKLTRDRKLEAWKKDRRKEAATRGERVSHSILVVTDDGHAIVQELARTSNGCEAKYLRVVVSTSACNDDSLTEDEFYVGCCVPRGCSASPTSWAYAFVDAATLEQSDAVRRFMPESSAVTITDEHGQIRPYRRSDPGPRFKEMMKSLPHWTPGGEITCTDPKRQSGTFESECSYGGGGASYRLTLASSGSDLTDDKIVWHVARVQVEGR
jgi:hypothetical protein